MGNLFLVLPPAYLSFSLYLSCISGGLLLSLLATSSLLLDRYLRQINEGFSIGFTSVLIIVSASLVYSSLWFDIKNSCGIATLYWLHQLLWRWIRYKYLSLNYKGLLIINEIKAAWILVGFQLIFVFYNPNDGIFVCCSI
jgi:hypothetical protein